MSSSNVNEFNFTEKVTVSSRFRDYVQLGKLRLSLTVVFSAGMAYLIALSDSFAWTGLIALLLGGLLITLAANAVNEALEIRQDAVMKRTAHRPLPNQRLSITEALTFAGVALAVGLVLLWLGTNAYAAGLGLLSFALYSFVYTPSKQWGAIAVYIGAIPGALPAVIGWVAATGNLTTGAWVLFALQYLWQLPHFWSIAWLAHDDYKRAGYHLMPNGGERTRINAFQIALFTALLVPAGLLPFWLGMTSLMGGVLVAAVGFLFFLQTVNLLLTMTRKAALLIMFGSFLYLPLILMILFFATH